MISTPDKSQYIGRTYEMSPLTGGGQEVATLVKSIFKMAKDNSVLQFTLVSYPDVDAPYNFARGKIYGGEMITELVQRQSKLMEDALRPGFLDGVPAINKKRLFITLQTPAKAVDDQAVETEVTTQDEFLSGLHSCGFGDARHVSAERLVSIYRHLARIYEPAPEVELDPLLPLNRQIYGPGDEFKFDQKDYALINGVYCGAVVPKKFPRKPAPALMNIIIGSPLVDGKIAEGGGGLRPKTPFIISTTVRLANQNKEATRVKRALDSRTKNAGKLFFSLGQEDSQQVVHDLSKLQKACNDGTNKYTYTSVVAFAFGKTKQEMIETRTTLMGAMNFLRFDARPVIHLVGQRFVQSLPMNFSPSIAEKLVAEAIMPATAAATLLPIYSDYTGNADLRGRHTGMAFVTERGMAYYWDMFRTNTNKNGILAGASGAGKSGTAQYMIECSIAEGTPVYYFDNGSSAKKLCDFIDGEFNQFSLRSDDIPSLVPFTHLDQEGFDDQKEILTALVLKMCYFNEAPDGGARIAVSESIAAAWSNKQNKATFHTVLECLEIIKSNSAMDEIKNEVVLAAANLIPRLRNFLESPARGKYFTGKSTLNPSKLFVVYELAGLDGDPHLKQCVLFLVMNQLMEIVKNKPGRKVIILDEAWQLLKDPGAAEIMEELYRKARKDDGSIWVLTQSPRDLAGFKTGDVILSQSAWKVVMAQESEEVEKIIKDGVMTAFANDAFFHRTIKDVRTVKGVYAGLLICGEDTYERCRLYIDPFTRVLFSTDGEERSEIFRLMREEKMSAVEAIERFTGDSTRSRRHWLKRIVDQLRTTDGLSDQQIFNEIKGVIDEQAHF